MELSEVVTSGSSLFEEGAGTTVISFSYSAAMSDFSSCDPDDNSTFFLGWCGHVRDGSPVSH